ncbi:MAG: hypothetical protein GC152_15955 [Alphaproteobacteria bacterium]|nr:hypothetical protein [Alphaproteobacteria bacterium]
MFFRFRDAAMRRVFNRAAEAILDTPAMPASAAGAPAGPSGPASDAAPDVAIVSQLRSKDLLPYLVAVKSFRARFGRGRIVVVDDGSLTSDDRAAIERHLGRVTFRPLSDGWIDGLPRGGCWERICVIAQECRDAYVIQVDADTVTLGPVAEVTALADANRPFAIADAPTPGVATFDEMLDYHAARRSDPIDHMQIAAEMAMKTAGLPEGRRYLRGSAAFAGFPKGADLFPLLHEIHAAMSTAIGAQWSEWGSEQVASNYAVANLGNAATLAPPGYVNHTPETDLDGASFVHFFGTYRHHGGRYARAARSAIRDLSRA